MGVSGCGKTTLLGILTGLVTPDCGSISGAETARFSAVFQEDRLCGNLTAAANIRLVTGNSRSAEEIDKALCTVGLEGCADKPVRDFSGGMKRRVALVRALLAEFSVIVLDEPFKGLDETTRARVSEWCRKMLTGKTAILVTHDRGDCKALSAAEVIELYAIAGQEQHSQ
ncbi:MAG: ATP-binding cassette domain-containing protein [Oscillospiraceae bacterium]|nr:ATP-binding cassette domain-containing protein [Oscillospiraceae bacterium]